MFPPFPTLAQHELSFHLSPLPAEAVGVGSLIVGRRGWNGSGDANSAWGGHTPTFRGDSERTEQMQE